MKKLSILTALFCSLFQISNAQYCTPVITCDGSISNVNLAPAGGAAILNSSSACDGYKDFSSTVAIPDLYVDNTYLLAITPSAMGASVSESSYEGFVLWVDWDQSETFDINESLVLPKNPGAGVPGVNTFSLSVPASAVAGNTRLRVMWNVAIPFTGVFDDVYACSSIDGDVEDYTVNIISPADLTPACAKTPSPADAATDLCNVGTTLSFVAPDADANPLKDPIGYNLSLWYDNAGTPLFLEEDIDLETATSFAITDVLTPGETYYWQVKPYNETETNEGCAEWSFTTAAEPNPSPVIAVDGDASRSVEVCAEADALFTLTDANSTSYALATYDWNGTDNTSYPLSDTTIADPIFNSTNFGTTYELALLVTDQYGCTGVDTVDVLVKERATPGTILAPSGTKVCEGETTDLTLSGYNGTIEWKYSYTNAVGALTTTGDFDDAYTTFPILRNTYFVAIVDLNGCADSTNIFIEKKDLPFQPGILDGGLSFCDGDSTSLQAVWPGVGTLTWDDAASSTTETIWVKETGTFTVTGTSTAAGCSRTSDPVTVTKNDNPNNPFVLEMGGSACEGDSTTIQVAISGADSLFWIDDNSGYNNDLDTTIKESATYRFVNRNNTGCTSDTVNYSVVFGTTPSKPTVNTLSNDSLQIIGDATTYYWYLLDGTLVGTETDSIFEPAENGTYYVVGGNGPCLGEPSDAVVVDLFSSVSDMSKGLNQIKVYPNPTKGVVTIINQFSGAKLAVIDVTGKLVYSTILQKGANQLNLELEKGVYLMLIRKDNTEIVERLIIE
jgi:hypothetical protein